MSKTKTVDDAIFACKLLSWSAEGNIWKQTSLTFDGSNQQFHVLLTIAYDTS